MDILELFLIKRLSCTALQHVENRHPSELPCQLGPFFFLAQSQNNRTDLQGSRMTHVVIAPAASISRAGIVYM